VISEHNAHDLPSFMRRCRALGVRRFVVRRLFGDARRWDVLPNLDRVRTHRGNPVYDFDGLEVTVWDFDVATPRSINLFADGTLGTEYLLTRSWETARGVDLRPTGQRHGSVGRDTAW
jgi:hypothetical protein